MLAVSLLLTSCASNARYERDRFCSSYQTGGDRLFISQVGSAVRAAAGDETIRAKTAPVTRPEDEAVTNLVFSGLALAMNRDYYKSPYISGRAQCHFEEEPEFEVPCGNTLLYLKDRGTGEVHSVPDEGGEFAFEGDLGHSYTLSLPNGRYELAQPVPNGLIVGDDIVLHLVRTRARAD
jgi:hypothetical protein